ncbi:unnamed protein product [Medioppia subpectinata]|uniref:Uncharacterized protein n=1 Tax=Medioppia subpectinata TaxID=1979941 RepID=A0A7R9KB43_9ACAR|nr:unnamed protein product [Medioppia subpectinata]CAG2100150.1 unnamed protein product [Medioppia subpectinata]
MGKLTLLPAVIILIMELGAPVSGMTEVEMDAMLRPIIGFGDPDYPQLYERKQLEAYSKGTLDEWLPHYKSVYDMNADMISIRDGYTRAMIAAAKPDSNYLNKWVYGTINTVKADVPRRIIRSQLSIYTSFIMTNSFDRVHACDWSNIPVPTGNYSKSIGILLFKALLNADKTKPATTLPVLPTLPASNTGSGVASVMTEQDLDTMLRPIIGFGDPNHPQLYERKQLEAYLTSDVPRRIIRSQLSVYTSFVMTNSFDRAHTCDWSNIPVPTGNYSKFIGILLIKALVNADKNMIMVNKNMTMVNKDMIKVDKGVPSVMTEQDVDMMLRPIFGFGDPDYPQIYERKQLEAYCNQKQNKGAGSDVNNILQKLYGKSPSAAKFIKFGYELVQSYNLTCDRIANGTLDEWLPYYKDIHDMNANMKPIRDGYTRAMMILIHVGILLILVCGAFSEVTELEYDNYIRPILGYGDMEYPAYHKRDQLEAY